MISLKCTLPMSRKLTTSSKRLVVTNAFTKRYLNNFENKSPVKVGLLQLYKEILVEGGFLSKLKIRTTLPHPSYACTYPFKVGMNIAFLSKFIFWSCAKLNRVSACLYSCISRILVRIRMLVPVLIFCLMLEKKGLNMA